MRLFYTALLVFPLLNLQACAEETMNISFKCETSATITTNMLSLVNQARSQDRICGDQYYPAAPSLRWNKQLVRAARTHTTDMATNNFFDHNGSDNSTTTSRIQDAGYPWIAIGENLTGGLETSEEVVSTLLRSPTHCAVIMNPQFSEIGSACQSNADSDLILYWALEFGAR